jgi:hypothetical protein
MLTLLHLIKGWVILLIVVTCCFNKSYQLKMLTYNRTVSAFPLL